MPNTSPPRATVAQVLVGLFICMQLLALVGMNVLPLVPHGQAGTGELMDDPTIHGRTSENELIQASIDWSAEACKRYGELTGQWQGWSLFSPLHPHQSTFPVVELRWSDGATPVRLWSQFEPQDVRQHSRLPDSWNRLFNYEFRLCQVLWFYDDADYAERPDEWREHVQSRVHRQRKSIRAYVQWRMQEYLSRHQGKAPPSEVLLLIHIYPSAPPGARLADRQPPFLRHVARWTPGQAEHCVEPLDPRSGAVFLPVSGREAS